MEHKPDSKAASGADGGMNHPSVTSHGDTESPVFTEGAELDTYGTETLECDSVSDPRLEQAFALIRAAIADAGENAVKEFIASLQSNAPKPSGDLFERRVTRHPDAEKRERAPAGSARVLCRRALNQAGDSGLTIKKIQDQATGEYEMKLSTSAIRNELGVGSTLTPPLYKQVGGVWYAAAHAPTLRAVGG